MNLFGSGRKSPEREVTLQQQPLNGGKNHPTEEKPFVPRSLTPATYRECLPHPEAQAKHILHATARYDANPPEPVPRVLFADHFPTARQRREKEELATRRYRDLPPASRLQIEPENDNKGFALVIKAEGPDSLDFLTDLSKAVEELKHLHGVLPAEGIMHTEPPAPELYQAGEDIAFDDLGKNFPDNKNIIAQVRYILRHQGRVDAVRFDRGTRSLRVICTKFHSPRTYVSLARPEGVSLDEELFLTEQIGQS
jgi:hypothetical protein